MVMETNFQSKLVSATEKGVLVYLVTASVKGKPAWHYIQVDEPKHKAFKKQMETGKLDLAEYGTILESGWGAYPPEPIVALMNEKYKEAA